MSACISLQVIHKFDKFNPQVSGLFHPLGLEVIINSEIWDLRTFKLLHTVPALNQCQIRFSHDASVLYGGKSSKYYTGMYMSTPEAPRFRFNVFWYYVSGVNDFLFCARTKEINSLDGCI